MTRYVTVLGATGSVGINTLDVIQQHPDRYRIFALTACHSVARMFELCKVYQPVYAVMQDADAAQQLQVLLQTPNVDYPHLPNIQVLAGSNALSQVAAADEVDVVVAAIVGAAGLRSTLAAVQASKTVLLANKEALVMGGAWLMQQVKQHAATVLPIDSEHNAIFQCLPPAHLSASQSTASRLSYVKKLWLTASGGPFREYSVQQLRDVTPEQACAHPVWKMGHKISVDSATMMNKGLELLEACWLFDVTCDQVNVIVHPSGVMHSMVEYIDGSIIAQMGSADMRIPIAHALAWPDRMVSGADPLDFWQLNLSFEPPRPQVFPCLQLARQAYTAGGAASIALNAANEVAVAAFLQRQIGFTDIADVIQATLDQGSWSIADWSVESIMLQDEAARDLANLQVKKRIQTALKVVNNSN